MLIHLPKLLTKEQVEELKPLLDNSNYEDGKLTAGISGVKIKNNLQLGVTSENGIKLNNLLKQIVLHDPRFWNLTFFKEILPFTFSLYETGMHYGLHLDNPVRQNARFRTDISMTIYLNSQSEYTGGELMIHSDYGVHACKADIGDAIIYPSNLLHEVKPVISGKRLVAITWIQSSIRDPQKRRILIDLINHISTLELEGLNRQQAQKCFNSLLLMWLEN